MASLLFFLPVAACGNASADEAEAASCASKVDEQLSRSMERIDAQVAVLTEKFENNDALDALASDRAAAMQSGSDPKYAQALGQLRARMESADPNEMALWLDLMTELEGFENRMAVSLKNCPEASDLVETYRRQIPVRVQIR